MARKKEEAAAERPRPAHSSAEKGSTDDSTTRVNQAEQFLRALYGDSAPGFLAISAVKAIKPGAGKAPLLTAWYQATDIASAAAKAVQLSRQRDVYVGLGLHREAGDAHHRGGADDVLAIPALWLDLDVVGATHGDTSKRYFPDQAQALAFLETLPLPPSLIVSSGGGLHLYWLFRELWVFDDPAERADAAALVEDWQRSIIDKAKTLGFDVDATHDLARILRVVGTFNHKASPALPVSILQRNDARYNPGDFEQWKQSGEKAQPSAAGEPALDLHGVLDAIKLDALLTNDRTFKRTWNKARSEMKDQSASAYDLALADVAVPAGWSDQEICNLLVGFRRKHGEDLKRPDYYATTIGKARAAMQPQADAARALEDGASTADPASKLAKLRELLRLPLARVLKRTLPNEEPQFALILDSGEEITVGGADDLLSQRHMRGVVAGSADRVMPRLKPAAWDKLAQLLLDIREREQLPEDLTVHAGVRTALVRYLERATLMQEPDGESPFWREDGLYFVGSDFREWCHLRHLCDLSGKQFGRVMKLLGITGESIPMRLRGRKPTSRHCWRVPDALTPERPERREQPAAGGRRPL